MPHPTRYPTNDKRTNARARIPIQKKLSDYLKCQKATQKKLSDNLRCKKATQKKLRDNLKCQKAPRKKLRDNRRGWKSTLQNLDLLITKTEVTE